MMTLNLAVKACTKCGQPSGEGFGAGRNRNQCKPCVRADQRARYVAQRPERIAYAKRSYLANPEASKARARLHAARIGPEAKAAAGRAWRQENTEKYLLDRARSRSSARSLAFDLTIVDVVIPEVCPVLGITIDQFAIGTPAAGSPSLDRIDNTLGYVRGNVAVISMRANQLKRDGTAEEHERVAAWMRTRTVRS